MAQEKTFNEAPERPSQGLADAELTAGRLVTISINKTTGDRSLCQVIWEVVTTNDGHALVKCRHLRHLLYGTPDTRLVSLNEHEFYAADALASALTPESCAIN